MSSKSHAPPLPLLLACAVLCAACAWPGGGLRIAKEARHANGLTVGVPEGFEAKQTESGYAVEPSGDQDRRVRNPPVAEVSFARGVEAPADPGFQTKMVGRREVRHRVTKSEGGSGGETYALDVYERVAGGHIRYSQAMQSETGEPDFALCWALVGSTKLREHP